VRLLVTGGTGLLGNNVIRTAIKKGHEVVSLSRSKLDHPGFAGLNVRAISADISDLDSMNRVVHGRFDAIVNCAAHIHIGWHQLEQGMKINRDGTRNLLTIAKTTGAKFIQVSTVNTLAVGSRDYPADEETEGDGQIQCTYVLSKRAADAEVEQAHSDGQHVVTVHPGFMLGPWDWNPSSGKMIQALQNPLLLSPSGGCSVCDPRDIAAAILNAIDHAPSGRHYVLAGENITYLDLWRRISSRLGARQAITYMRRPGRLVSGMVGDLIGKWRGKEGDVNSASIAVVSQFHWYSSQRAMDELAYQPRSADESIEDAIRWLRENGMLGRATI
jgi:dihydroflavonol-4-reductase